MRQHRDRPQRIFARAGQQIRFIQRNAGKINCRLGRGFAGQKFTQPDTEQTEQYGTGNRDHGIAPVIRANRRARQKSALNHIDLRIFSGVAGFNLSKPSLSFAIERFQSFQIVPQRLMFNESR